SIGSSDHPVPEAARYLVRWPDLPMTRSSPCLRVSGVGFATAVATPSLLVDGGGFAAQHVLLDLAGGGLGKLRHECEAMRNFEVCHPFAREFAELVFGGGAARFQHHERARGFSPLLVGNADNRDFLYGGMAEQNAFHFDRGDVLAAADDYIF